MVANAGASKFQVQYHEGERYQHLAREALGAELLTPN